VIAAFTLVYALSETAAAPHEPTASPEPVILETPEPEPTEEPEPDEPDDDPSDEPEPGLPPPTPLEDGFITLYFEEADIHRGPLILVNHDHRFTIPNDLDLVNIVAATQTTFRVQNDSDQLSNSIIGPLDEMMSYYLSASGNRSVAIISAFRNIDSQQRLLNSYINRMGRTMALQYAALPGHSEHHTGLAFDFGIIINNTRSTFVGTNAASWFRRNSHRFGFILRYPENKTHITQTAHEPWHFRYVGLPHSTIMYSKGWVLEEFIENMREYTMEEPFEFEHDGELYKIYFNEGPDIRLPLDSEFELSGNNIDGFIVTVTRSLTYDFD